MKNHLVLTCLAVCFTFTQAQEEPPRLNLVLHGLSSHGELKEQIWQERNWGTGVRYQIDRDWGVQGGAYRNSYDRATVYGVIQWTPLHLVRFSAGGFLGLASNYPQPVVGGFLGRYQHPKYSVGIRYVPKISKQTASVTTFEIDFPIGMR